MLSLLFPFRKKSTTQLEEAVQKIQQGDESLRNKILEQYQPFIAKTVSSTCKRYIDKKDDEFSIGLISFNEAIENYAKDKGSSFLAFASLLIKRRVIDYIRKEGRQQTVTMNDDSEENNSAQNIIESTISISEYNKTIEAEQRKEEILHLQSALTHFGLTFEDLLESSPKHQDARENMIHVAKQLVNDETLKTLLFEKKRLPVKALMENVTVSRKTIERNRKYIIGMAMILSGDYIYLKDYLKGVLEG